MIVAFYAAVLGLMHVALTLNVGLFRVQNKISLGTGGNETLERRMRAHGNFIETVPMALILIGLLEVHGITMWVIHALCILLVFGRIVHAASILKPSLPWFFRPMGMFPTLLVILISAIWLLYKMTPAVF